MYEVTVSTPSNEKHILDNVCQDICPYIRQIGGTVATVQQKHRSYFSLACADTFQLQAQRLLQDSVAKGLSLGYKNIFVRDMLDVQEGNFYQNILVDTMCAFDHQYDADILSKLIDAQKDIYIDGYYHFRIQNFKRKWENVENMVLENNYILGDHDLILEFLQYLLQSVDPKLKKLSICFDKNSYTLYDGKGKVIQKCPTMSPSVSVEEDAIVNAICLNPQKLKVYHAKPLSQDFLDVVKALFNVQFVLVQ